MPGNKRLSVRRECQVRDPGVRLERRLPFPASRVTHFDRATVGENGGKLSAVFGESDGDLGVPGVGAFQKFLPRQRLPEMERSIRLDPRHIEARVQYVRYLQFVGRHREGMVQLREARAIDPASALVLSWMSYGYFLQRQMDSAIVESARAQENDPENLSTVGLRARVLLGVGKNEEARLLAPRAPFWDQLYILAKSGDLSGAREGLAALDAQSPQPWLAEMRRAHAYLGLGDTARALSALERAIAAKGALVALYGPSDPNYDGIRESPRFQALLRKVGLEP